MGDRHPILGQQRALGPGLLHELAILLLGRGLDLLGRHQAGKARLGAHVHPLAGLGFRRGQAQRQGDGAGGRERCRAGGRQRARRLADAAGIHRERGRVQVPGGEGRGVGRVPLPVADCRGRAMLRVALDGLCSTQKRTAPVAGRRGEEYNANNHQSGLE